jgi:pyridoxine/pyridoxamine 5'-phosphate oxidase
MTKEELLAFISKHNLAAISTVAEGNKPEAAVLEFAETSSFELIFLTNSSSRKYANLQNNPAIAFVIGWDENITVQYEGSATELSGAELQEAKDVYFAKIPRALKWGNNPGMAYFKVKPHWIRITDLNVHPWGINEFKF